MFFNDIHIVTVVIAAAVSMALGFVWYSPFVFGKRWMKEMRHAKDGSASMAKTYAISTALMFVTAYVIAGLLNSLIVIGFNGLIGLAFFVWAAFSMPVAANYVIYGKDSFPLFLINTGYQLLSIILMTLVIGIFG